MNPPATAHVVAVEPGSQLVQDVLRLHRAAKATLGFLPDSGFADRAGRGTLLAAVRDGRTVGYVMFDLTGEKVKLRHLCVDPHQRGLGVARRLIDELTGSFAHRRCIELDCRRDYGLAEMWKALGFHAVYDRSGRSREGHLLTVWHLDFGHPTLFSSVPPVGDLVCLDQMVFEDLVVERSEGLHTRHLLEDWVGELVELCITDEVFDESNDVDDDVLRRRLLEAAQSYRNLSRAGAPWDQNVRAAAGAAPGAGAADHRHLARAVEGGARYFVTRDDQVLGSAAAIATRCALLVLSPEGLLDRLDRDRAQDRYEPAVLQGTTFTHTALEAASQGDFAAALLNHGAGEKAHRLRAQLRTALADREHSEVRVVRDGDGEIVAGAVRTREHDRLLIDALRVRRADRLTEAVARQLVFQQRKDAADRAVGLVEVRDTAPSAAVARALVDEGFEPSSTGWRCRPRRGLHAAEAVLDRNSTARDGAAWERRHWPAKVLGAGLKTFIVSIEPAWAERLFEATLAEATLFPRDPVLGLSREHVYYRGPGRNLHGPARVLWYVKGGKPGHPTGHVRAVSHLIEVIVDRPRTLHSRFARLGVWTLTEVEAAAWRTGSAMALRLTDTELFARPLGLSELRKLYADHDRKFTAPQSPIAVDEHMFCLIYGESSAYA